MDSTLMSMDKNYWKAQEALWKEILKGDSKKIWHGVHWEDLTPEQRKLILPMMKNYIEKYLPSGY